jgi:hypothetical protein
MKNQAGAVAHYEQVNYYVEQVHAEQDKTCANEARARLYIYGHVAQSAFDSQLVRHQIVTAPATVLPLSEVFDPTFRTEHLPRSCRFFIMYRARSE